MVSKTVAFTGRGIHPPNLREALAVKNQIIYKTTVTAGCDLLGIRSASVANAQVDKSRETGVPVMTEAMFWQMLVKLKCSCRASGIRGAVGNEGVVAPTARWQER